MISPELSRDNIANAMDYYEKVLGFRRGMVVPSEGGQVIHGEMWLGDRIHLMFSWAKGGHAVVREKLDKGGPRGTGVLLYIDLGDMDVDKYYDGVKSRGAQIVEPLQDQMWGDRTFTIEDPEGYVLTFAKHLRDVDLSQIQVAQH